MEGNRGKNALSTPIPGVMLETRTPNIQASIAALKAVTLPELLVAEDLALWLRITTSGARRLCRTGRVPAAKLGRRWLIPRDALLRRLALEAKA